MKRARAFGFWGLSIVCAATFVYACSSSSSGVTGGGGTGEDATTGDDGSSGGDGSSTTDSGGSKDSGTGGEAGTGPCSSTSSYDDCLTCCDGYSDGGITEYYTLQFECLCQANKCDTNAKCKKTFCTDPGTADAGTACNNCIDKELADDAGDAGCIDPVIDECAADMGCATGLECVVNSDCADKP
ncbi:MAG: hypothetical protein ACRELY_03210 [Polyangiaceae bacterium]